MKPSLSVVCAVHNGAQFLPSSLSAILAATDADTEIILVNDGSTDDSAEIGRLFGAKVITLEKCSGAANARNVGALESQGEIILFVDADVVVQADTISHLRRIFSENPEYSAVFGSYDTSPGEPDFFSQYRNLMHHFFHQIGCPDAETFWSGLGAVKREAFLHVGSFDSDRYKTPSVEDIELGYRLREKGYRVLLVPELQAKHLKRWTFQSIIKTDFWYRAVPWVEIMLHYPNARHDLNVKTSQKFSALLAGIFILSLGFVFFKWWFLLIGIFSLILLFVINKDFYAFFLRHRGFSFTFLVFPMNLLYFGYSSLAFVYSWSNVKIVRPFAASIKQNFSLESKPEERLLEIESRSFGTGLQNLWRQNPGVIRTEHTTDLAPIEPVMPVSVEADYLLLSKIQNLDSAAEGNRKFSDLTR
jgi:GT2 family glycosyltransferase